VDQSRIFAFLFLVSNFYHFVQRIGFLEFSLGIFGNGSESENCSMSELFLFGNLVWAWLGTGLGLGHDWKGFLK
jgi:hypothetical protein